MCILFLAIRRHPDHPLIVAANRDEYFDRPSTPMHYWPDAPHLLAGRDGLKGGSWLGVNRSGRFCAVTNFRTGEAADPNARSRGELVRRFLDPGHDGDEMNDAHGGGDAFTRWLARNHRHYNPFNLIYGDREQLRVFCSRNATHQVLAPGCHGVSNGFIDQRWPKTSSGVRRLTALFERPAPIDPDGLNRIMRDRTQATDDDLPDTGIDRATEKQVSSIFIRGETYGTRTTTCLLFDHAGATVHETNYDNRGRVTDRRQHRMEFQ